MLAELRIENLLLIERAELALDPGLNVITGETGAGKTMVAHALDLLLGGKPRRSIVRPGASEAYVEGVFTTDADLTADPDLAQLAERVPLDADDLVLARRVASDGRTRAYLQGRSVSATDLRAVGERLVAFYGQHEHRKLTVTSTQLEVLDAFCGRDHLDVVTQCRHRWAEARDLERRLEELRARLGERERDLDLLEFEIGEIEEVAPSEDEDAELQIERSRLSSLDALRTAAGGASSALFGEEGEGGAESLLAAAAKQLGGVPGADPRLDELAERCGGLAYEAQELSRELRDYGSDLEADPGRLARSKTGSIGSPGSSASMAARSRPFSLTPSGAASSASASSTSRRQPPASNESWTPPPATSKIFRNDCAPAGARPPPPSSERSSASWRSSRWRTPRSRWPSAIESSALAVPMRWSS